MVNADKAVTGSPSWTPLVVVVMLTLLAVYVVIWGDTLLETYSLPFFMFLGTVASQRKSGSFVYRGPDTTVEGKGAGAEAAAKLAEKHRRQVAMTRRVYLAAALAVALAAVLLAVFGPAANQTRVLVAEICLFVMAFALLGYSINLKLFGFIDIESSTKS